jgi:hypothetical protein
MRAASVPLIARSTERSALRAFLLICLSASFLTTTAIAGDRIWVPVRWCGVEGAPSMENPGVVNEGSSDDVLWRRHERPTDQIYQDDVNMTFRAGATAAIKNGPQSFPIIEDPVPGSGNALGDTWNDTETTDVIFICRRAWMLGDPLYLDTNNNGTVDAGTDTLLSTGLPAIGVTELGHDGTALVSAPSDVKFVDANTNGNYNIGENIYRDEDNDNTVGAGDTLLVNVSGTVVANIDAGDSGAALVAVPSTIKYVDLIRNPANTYNIGYPAVQGITAINANDVEFTGIAFPVHGIAQPGLGGLGAVMDDPSQYLPPGPDFTMFETQLVGHEFGHAFTLPHGDGIDDDADGMFDETNEDPAAPVPGAGPNTLCDSNNVMSYCWLDNGTSGNPNMTFIGVGAPEVGSFTGLQVAAMRGFVLANVPDRIVDPVAAPLVAARVDLLGDTPDELQWLDISDYSVNIDDKRETLSLSVATRRPFPKAMPNPVQFNFIIDADSRPTSGADAETLNSIGIKSDFKGAEFAGTVQLKGGEIVAASLFEYSAAANAFQPVNDQRIRGLRRTVELIPDFPMGRKAIPTATTIPATQATHRIPSHEIISLVSSAGTLNLGEDADLRVEYQTQIDDRIVDRARTPGMRFDKPVFPVCRTDPEKVHRGQTTSVISTGLLPERDVHLLLGDEEISTGTTDINGSVVLNMPIPQSARTGQRLVTVGALAVSADCSVTVLEDDVVVVPPVSDVCCPTIVTQLWIVIVLVLVIALLLIIVIARRRG